MKASGQTVSLSLTPKLFHSLICQGKADTRVVWCFLSITSLLTYPLSFLEWEVFVGEQVHVFVYIVMVVKHFCQGFRRPSRSTELKKVLSQCLSTARARKKENDHYS